MTRLLFAAAMLLAATTSAPAAPAASLVDPYWQGAGSDEPPDHAAWDSFLAAHTRPGPDGVRRLDYAAAVGDRGALQAYLAGLAAIDPTSLPRPEQFAYWANLYNALTVDVVLDAWPVESIRRIGGSLFSPGPWRDPVVTVAGRELSLDNIEHGILRPIWQDARVHYAVNCASIGCPDLATKAFRGDGLEAVLDALAAAYVNHPRGARVEGGRLQVSSIYDWFEADFGGDDAGVIAHLRRYAEPDLAAALAGIERISGHDYDWALNGVP